MWETTMLAQGGYKWLRWFVLDHALLLILIVLVMTIISVLLYRAGNDFTQRNLHLQRSVEDHL